ncbi:GHKL domain-containing protein [Clostridium sp. 'deep sea']|nr:GHKL domain-containing protein [Clostridium sp. 'deep sea']
MTFVLGGIFLAFFILGHDLIVWYNTNSIFYIIGKLLDNNRLFFFIVSWIFCLLIIISYYVRKTISYVDTMTLAIDKVFTDDSNPIKLPDDLEDIELRLNEIKYDRSQNQKLAKEAEQRKNDLVVYLAHDLKTPLTSVLGYLTLLRDEENISPSLKQKYLEIATDKAARLEILINEFFDITRFNLMGLSLETTTFNLAFMLQQIAYEFNPLFADKNLTCKVDVPDELFIKGDVGKLERVFDNLIRNAINYSFKNSEIQIIAIENEDGVIVKFANSGDSIPQHKLRHIFEQFYRLDSSRGSHTGGSGLGLAIAKQIVELHNGTIKATSENEVIEFEIYLPLYTSENLKN